MTHLFGVRHFLFWINCVEVLSDVFGAGGYIGRINIHRRGDAGVAEALLDILGMPAGGEELGRVRVPETFHGDGKARFFGNVAETL